MTAASEGPDQDARRDADGAPAADRRDTVGAILAHLADDEALRYEVGEEIAAGGMGVVLRVREEVLERELAMKVIRPDLLESTVGGAAVRRFLDEARITAQLDHPGVVPVHELSMDDRGRLYFTMKLVGGRTFKEVILDARDPVSEWTVPRALQLVERVCETMSYAHAKGVVHRDLKPDNVMVGDFGEVYVMDWGVAKRLHAAESTADASAPADPGLTRAGDVVGTPSYMAPEQARGNIEAQDARGDVYSIGAMLYELLVGDPPYADEATTSIEVLRLALRKPPTPIGRLRSGLPGELVAIVDKAMAREPEQRYADASEVARDLRAFLEGRVVAAHRTDRWTSFRKWVARNKALAASLLTAGLAVSAGLVVSLVLLAEATRQSREARREARRFRLTAAGLALTEHRHSEARLRLDQIGAADGSWEWRHLASRLDDSLLHLPGIRPHLRDDHTVVLRSGDDVVSVDLDSRQETLLLRGATAVQFCGRYGAGRTDTHAEAWDLVLRKRIFSQPVADLYDLEVTGNGRLVVQRQERERIAVYQLPGSEAIFEWADRDRGEYRGVDRAGRRVAAADTFGTVWVFDVDSGREIRTVHEDTGVADVDFLPDGDAIATAAQSRVRLWPAQGAVPTWWREAPSAVLNIRFDPTGKRLAVQTEGGVLDLRDAATGDLISRWQGVFAGGHLDFGTEDLVATANDTNGIQIWSALPDPRLLRGHQKFLYAVLVTPDGSRVVSGGWDGYYGKGKSVRVWDQASGRLVCALGEQGEGVLHLDWHEDPQGRRFLLVSVVFHGGEGAPPRLYDADTGERIETGLDVGHKQRSIFLADGRLLVPDGSGPSGAAVVFDPRTGRADPQRLAHAGYLDGAAAPSGLAASPDGKWIATTLGDYHTVQIWSADTLEPHCRLEGHTELVTSIAFHPDGRVVTTSRDQTARVWDAASGEELFVLRGHGDRVNAGVLSPSGDRIFTGGQEGTIRVWDGRRYDELVQLSGHVGHVFSLALTPDGGALFSGGDDTDVHVWDTQPVARRIAAGREYDRMVERLAPIVAGLGEGADAVKAIRNRTGWTAREREVALQLLLSRAAGRD